MSEAARAMAEPIDPSTHRAIEHLVHEHAWLIDNGQASRVVELYTPTAACWASVHPNLLAAGNSYLEILIGCAT